MDCGEYSLFNMNIHIIQTNSNKRVNNKNGWIKRSKYIYINQSQK